MGVFANNSCYFAAVNLQAATDLDLTEAFGIWSRFSPYEDYCVEYTAQEETILLDGKWRGARAMAVLANVCGGVTLIIAICLSCVSIPKMFLNATALLSVCAGFFQCLTFIFFASDACETYNCQFSHGAGVAIGAVILYMLNTCIILRIPMYEGGDDEMFTPPPPNAVLANEDNPPPGSVQVTVTEMPDGTKKTTRTVVNADGSRTVTETIEHPATANVPMAAATPIPSGSAEPAKTY